MKNEKDNSPVTHGSLHEHLGAKIDNATLTDLFLTLDILVRKPDKYGVEFLDIHEQFEDMGLAHIAYVPPGPDEYGKHRPVLLWTPFGVRAIIKAITRLLHSADRRLVAVVIEDLYLKNQKFEATHPHYSQVQGMPLPNYNREEFLAQIKQGVMGREAEQMMRNVVGQL